MVLLLSLLALAMIVSGGASMVFGAPIIQTERGWTMVIAGSMVASSGAVVLALALAAQRLGRLVRETVQVRDRLAQIEELTAIRAGERVLAATAAVAEPVDVPPFIEPPLPAAPPLPPSPDANTVVGQYASGGNSYTMYSDGSIRAETPAGERVFGSLEELRQFVASGGEKTG